MAMDHLYTDCLSELGDVIEERDRLLKVLKVFWHSDYVDLMVSEVTQESSTDEHRRLVTKELFDKFSSLVGSASE